MPTPIFQLLTLDFFASVPPSLYYVAGAALLLLVWLLLRARARAQYRALVYRLFGTAAPVQGPAFRHADLDDPTTPLGQLPEPVRHYFRTVLPDGQVPISYLRLQHDGLFRTNLKQGWLKITGKQYFAVANPGFVWRGRTSNLVAIDSYVNRQGSLQVWLLGIARLLNARGPAYDQGEVLRWLGEAVWFPTALLPGGPAQWAPHGNLSAILRLQHGGQDVTYTVFFNKEHEIERLETDRFMGPGRQEHWVGRLSHYELRQGVLVPTQIEGAWHIQGKDHPYARFRLTQFEYDKPEIWA